MHLPPTRFRSVTLKEGVVLADLQGSLLGTGNGGKANGVEHVSMRLGSQDSFESMIREEMESRAK